MESGTDLRLAGQFPSPGRSLGIAHHHVPSVLLCRLPTDYCETVVKPLLESRGWSAQPTGSSATTSARNRPADYTAIRRCLQEALYSLGMCRGTRDGSNSPAWQRAQKVYLAGHEMPVDPPPSDEQLREILDRDLVARRLSMNWPVCLEASQR